MNLQKYLERIGFRGKPSVDIDTLTRIHRGHLLAIPYENLDVQLGHKLDLDVHRIYQKLVVDRRGGWCYEMNGLMEWALREIGFDVTRVNGGVMRVERGDDALGNHLVLLVRLVKTWVADVGFGDGVIDPIPLAVGEHDQRGFKYRLEKVACGVFPRPVVLTGATLGRGAQHVVLSGAAQPRSRNTSYHTQRARSFG